MIFHSIYRIKSENRNATEERFKATAAAPPKGVKLLGRWHDAGGLHGFMVSEASSAVDIAKWCQEWTDVIEFEVTPVISDEELASVMD
jgi:hypothetical protein